MAGIDGAVAHRLHVADGLTWSEVGRALNCKARAAKSAAWRWQRAQDKPQGEARTSYKEDANTIIATVTGGICTLEGLVEAHRIDLTVWQVDGRVRHNTWTTPAFKHGEWTVFQNHQVTANFVRREPQLVMPMITPLTTGAVSVSIPEVAGAGTALVLADAHIGFRKRAHDAQLEPFHDRRALSVALQLAAHRQPDTIVFLGDWLDCAEWSDRFTREPEFYHTTQPALNEAHYWLKSFRAACPEAALVYHEGNHERRVTSALLNHLPAAYDLHPAQLHTPALELPYLLGLDSLGVTWAGCYPNDATWLGDGLVCGHGDIARAPGNTAKALAQADTSQIVGHVHRVEVQGRTVWARDGVRTVTGYAVGCLCRIDGAVPAQRERQQWQQGVAWVEYDERDHAVTLVGIGDGRARGYTGTDDISGLQEMFPDWRW